MAKRKTDRLPEALDWGASIVIVIIVIVGQYLERGQNPFVRGAGLVVLVLACVFYFPPLFLLQRHGGAGEGQHPMDTNVVVDRGLYSIVRHPQYLGYILLVLGFVCLFQNLTIVVLGALAIALFYGHTVREERYCIQKFGREYENYVQTVPRFNVILGIIRHLARRRASREK
jgi:protein-S-isoprenylcysteine O-methyltransferase Ste14